ncbi:ribonucleoside-triphosphate reductase, adenosylcobalamin-dependent [Thermosynechococcaceae cyanobacterium Okahandja]
MVQNPPRPQTLFPASAPTAYPVFYRTYSRQDADGQRESWQQVCDRTIQGLKEVGHLSDDEVALLTQMQHEIKALPSGRWLWVGGTDWVKRPENYSGAYNCTSTNVVDWDSFGLMMDLAMQGCGTGAVLEHKYISQLPPIRNRLEIEVVGTIGQTPKAQRQEFTTVTVEGSHINIKVGDSRQGWVQSYQAVLEASTDPQFNGHVTLTIDISDVRPTGERLKGFGGVANPVKLAGLYHRCAVILNAAVGRQLTSVECCLLIDEAATVVVAGNVRRSAGMRQGDSNDAEFAAAKQNLWQQDAQGNWFIDPARDALRMANHTRVFHRKPTLEECISAVRSQFYCGEGAIQWAGEAIARGNADLLTTATLKQQFLRAYEQGQGEAFLKQLAPNADQREIAHRLGRYGLNPCGEILSADFHCNLSEIHLNQIDPADTATQEKAFRAGAISVAALLNHRFEVERYRYARELDPIVGVSFTGLFDFFVHAFGVEWLNWWAQGRPDNAQGQAFKAQEAAYLQRWKEIVHAAVWDYCDRHGLKRPNRCTTVQPAGTKSLLTGASPGWHPPKAQRFIRRITFRKGDPVAMACYDYGYNVIPSQSDKDEQGKLLDDPFDPRCSEWLVEIPVAVSWADLPGADAIDISQFSALAQFDFYMQVQQHYTTHNTSATIELREHEIEPLATAIYEAIQHDQGYMSAALLARFDANETFPRLPFEPISKERYEQEVAAVRQRRRMDDFHAALSRYTQPIEEAGPAGCDSDKCLR